MSASARASADASVPVGASRDTDGGSGGAGLSRRKISWVNSSPLSKGAAAAQRRLPVIEALIAAVERREDVMRVVASAEDGAQAASGIAALLGIDTAAAATVVGSRLELFTRRELGHLRAEADRYRSRIAEG